VSATAAQAAALILTLTSGEATKKTIASNADIPFSQPVATDQDRVRDQIFGFIFTNASLGKNTFSGSCSTPGMVTQGLSNQ